MGGNIFKDRTRRYTRDEYFKITKDVVTKLAFSVLSRFLISDKLEDSIQPIKAYRTKESFGDLDIIINSSNLLPDWIPKLVAEFGLGHGDWSKNGHVLSFVYERFQIDLIVTPPEHYQSSLDYFAWNDCGNLQGRIAHKLGIRYGHRGAELNIKEGDYDLGCILLSTNTREIHEVLDLDHDVWLAGFETLEDMYRWVVSSKFFNKDIYTLDNRNHYARTRDRKRAVYSGFLEWIENNPMDNAYPYADVTEMAGYNIREPFYTDIIVPKFPHVVDEYNDIIEKYIEQNKFKARFNGEIVRALTGYEGKELGEFMAFARREIDRTKTKFLFLKYEQHTCNMMILSLHLHYIKGWEWLSANEQEAIAFARNYV
jgi:hypothetical protein